jgi:uncharacterized protein YdaU (DUF1376 family)
MLIDRYLGDTTMLSTEQHGAYFLLLLAMWKAGGVLPDDDGKLAQAAKLTPRRWAGMRDTIRPFFRGDGNGGLVQKRLMLELRRAEQRIDAGRKGARNRWRSDGERGGETGGELGGEKGGEKGGEVGGEPGGEPGGEVGGETMLPTPTQTPTNTQIQGLSSAVSGSPARSLACACEADADPENDAKPAPKTSELTVQEASELLTTAGLKLRPHDNRVRELLHRRVTAYELQQAAGRTASHVHHDDWMPYLTGTIAGMRADEANKVQHPPVQAPAARAGSNAAWMQQLDAEAARLRKGVSDESA